MNLPVIYGPEPLFLEGKQGSRYWVSHPYAFTDNPVVDERLSGYPVAVFQPHGRPAAETPLVIGMQGMAAPYQWNAFLVPTLLDLGIACVLFDTPLAGERSLARNNRGDVVSEIAPLVEQKFSVDASLVPRLMDAVARDVGTVLGLVRERHGLTDGRVALFGVSLGTLFAAYTFARDSIGTRLLGTLGHADLFRFARSYTPGFGTVITSGPGRLLGRLAALYFGPTVTAGIEFLAALQDICTGGPHCAAANPMSFSDRVSGDRRVRFLVGNDDPLVRIDDARTCAGCFPDGESYTVPGLGHGSTQFGPSFVDHTRYFMTTQLGDWRA